MGKGRYLKPLLYSEGQRWASLREYWLMLSSYLRALPSMVCHTCPGESLIWKGSPLRVCCSPTLKAPQIDRCCRGGEISADVMWLLLFKSRRTFSYFNVLLWHVGNGYFMEFISYSLSEHFELRVLETNWSERFTSALADLCNPHYCLG